MYQRRHGQISGKKGEWIPVFKKEDPLEKTNHCIDSG